LGPFSGAPPIPAPFLHIPRRLYAARVALATAAALVAAGLIASLAGADARTAAAAVLALGIGSIATFIPAVMVIGPGRWGIAVLLSGVGRALIVLGAAYAMDHAGAGLPTRPLYFGAVGGAVLVLVLETVAAIRILARMEHIERSGVATASPR
jgi:hypothetical protein